MTELVTIAVSTIVNFVNTTNVFTSLDRFLMRRKRRFLVVPPSIVENVVNELRGRTDILTVDLDNDPYTVSKGALGEDRHKALMEFLGKSPSFKYTIIRKYIKYTTFVLSEKHIRRVVFVTSDVSLFRDMGYSQKHVRFSYATTTFTGTLDTIQQETTKKFNESIEKFTGKIIRFDDLKQFNEEYKKILS